jgi:uncharacterized Zn-finger protein
MKPVEVVFVRERKVICDGTKGLSPHPKVYLNIGKSGRVVCPYCSKRYTLKTSESAPISFLKKNI